MIVCICNAIREAEIRETVRQGATEPECAYARLGCEPRCGQCLPFAAEIIEEERSVAA